jgi:hypothetical protein
VSSVRDIYICVLISTASLALQSLVSLNIYNQYQGICLISPVYFIHGGRWNVAPVQEIDTYAIMRNLIEFNPGQEILEGALVYKIQRKHVEYNEFIQEESESILLLVAWRVEHRKGLYVRALLAEYGKEFNWDEDKLRKLHQKYWHLLKSRVNPVGSNWLLSDATALATSVEVMNGGYRWDIFISEGIKNNVKRLLWIDVER